MFSLACVEAVSTPAVNIIEALGTCRSSILTRLSSAPSSTSSRFGSHPDSEHVLSKMRSTGTAITGPKHHPSECHTPLGSSALATVNLNTLTRRICSTLLFPQTCVLLEQWVLNTDWSPLCRWCFSFLPSLPKSICYYRSVPIPGNLMERFSNCPLYCSCFQPFDFARSCGP